MTTPSKFSGTGLSILIGIPLVQGDDIVGNFTDAVSDYTHTISSNGGYTSADFTIAGNNEFLEEWLEYGLGRDIKVFGPQQQIVWEGFVNQVDVNMGAATFTKGPLTNVVNRVMAWYAPYINACEDDSSPTYDPSCLEEGEVATGSTFPTFLVDDEDSQKKYGIWEKVLNIGEVWYWEAEYIRDLYLEENKTPEGNPSLKVGENTGDMSVKVSCRGYYDWLSAYIYNDDAPGDFIYVSEQIKNILGVEPNNVISTAYDKIQENMVITLSQVTEDKTAKTLIDDIITYGGGNDDRWTFGIYKDRKAVYSPIPSELEYIYYKSGKTQQVEWYGGGVVEPWDVLPCKWAAIPTFLTSFSMNINDIRKDPRAFFCEEVSFTAPDQVSLSGAKVRRLSQYLAKLGLGGV